MTLEFRRILVPVRDLEHPPGAALRKAAALGGASAARIELLHVVEDQYQPSADGLERAGRRLERIARSPAMRGRRVQSSLVADAPAHEAIVRRALAFRADLVVAATREHGRAARMFLRNTDWELIRHCPVPLLLAKSSSAYSRPVILVAVDPFHARAKPARLDAQLLAGGKDIARLLGGSVHLFHAYMPLPAQVEGPLGEPVLWENAEIENIHSAQVRRVFDRLAEKAGIPPARRHLAMGDVASELPATVRRLRAAVVVMGAVSRSGLRRVFIGSTAERVLDRLGCDVLILKPRGFKSGVSRLSRQPVRAGR